MGFVLTLVPQSLQMKGDICILFCNAFTVVDAVLEPSLSTANASYEMVLTLHGFNRFVKSVCILNARFTHTTLCHCSDVRNILLHLFVGAHGNITANVNCTLR